MAYHYKPYNTSAAAPKYELWVAAESATHPLKSGSNADAFVMGPRYMGVLDGVSGVVDLGLEPAAMADNLAIKIADTLSSRLDRQMYKYPQSFDRDIQMSLKSSVPANAPGLRILTVIEQCFCMHVASMSES